MNPGSRRLGAMPRRFFRNILIVMSGTGVSQLLAIAASPLLTRLYDPAAFGVFGVFLAISALVTPLAAFSYDTAIVTAKRDSDARLLATMCLVFVCCVSVVTALTLLALSGQFWRLLGVPAAQYWYWLVPSMVLLTGLHQTLNHVWMRGSQFSLVSVSRVCQSLGALATHVGAGLAGLVPAGLLAGAVAGQLASLLPAVAVGLRRGRYDRVVPLRKHDFVRLLREHLSLAAFKSLQRLTRTGSEALVTLLITALFGAAAAGAYALTKRVMAVPSELAGESYRKVFFPRIAQIHHSSPASTRAEIRRSMAILLTICSIPTIAVSVFGQSLFAFMFGEEWRQAGDIASIMVVLAASRLVTTPSTASTPVLGLQRPHFLIDSLRLGGTVVAVAVGASFGSLTIALIGIVMVSVLADLTVTALVLRR